MADWFSIDAVTKLWDWTKGNLDIWVTAVGSLRSVLEKYDLDGPEALQDALRFSFFPVFLAFLVHVPILAFAYDDFLKPFKIVGDLVIYYVYLAIWSAVLWCVVRIFLRRTSMRRCSILMLFGASYFPILEMLDYLTETDKDYRKHLYSWSAIGDRQFARDFAPQLVLLGVLAALAYLFVLIRLIPAIKLICKVGWARATAISLIHLPVAAAVASVVTMPITGLMLGR